MAEWLRRLTRNQMGYSRVGSNPTHSVFLDICYDQMISSCSFDAHFTISFRFLEELGRHNYVTPTSYLELISAFKTLLNQKQTEVGCQHTLILQDRLLSEQKT